MARCRARTRRSHRGHITQECVRSIDLSFLFARRRSLARLLRAEKYVSLAFLLKLDMIPDDRQKLVNAYLTLPVYEDMCPLHIVWNDGELYYSSAMGNKHRWDVMTLLENDVRTLARGLRCFGREISLFIKAVVETLKGELSKGKGPFSFLEFESRRGEISLPLATAFPESSFISLESEKKLAYVHFENVTVRRKFVE